MNPDIRPEHALAPDEHDVPQDTDEAVAVDLALDDADGGYSAIWSDSPSSDA